MIYITGDTHNINDMSNLSAKNMKLCCMEQGADYSAITYAIVLGDFGLPWYKCPVDEQGIHPTDKTDKHLLKWYNEKHFKILAVPDNHDNYDMIAKLPQVPMFGAIVGKVSENVFYLNRGEIYEIEGKRILVLGGALSEDKASELFTNPGGRRNDGQKQNRQLALKKYRSRAHSLITFFLIQVRHQELPA